MPAAPMPNVLAASRWSAIECSGSSWSRPGSFPANRRSSTSLPSSPGRRTSAPCRRLLRRPDLSPNSTAELRADITDIPFDAGRFDYVICNHVLEHVPDDRRAMREIHRLLKPTGTAIMQHPVDAHREATFEDPSITSAQERLRLYGQRDHVRIYGRDFPDRLRQAGFAVEMRDFCGELDAATVARHGLADEPIYLCTKAPVDRSARVSTISQSAART